ncbi:hypothetical protein KXD93_28365 [Mucilaginibacter sp. BJC16-A38]|uniref:hypothetical protein n=1 Tax=Mucilaginibacter phenanthrenivorans TaxID=1234842 RepID=UPI002157FA19|nr:hypothetical protein [Mucilaginibacter phenanthrenivorans]MCR8561602.1 hypothetical protein [Mucilaginibacter phenanthrenivorans]
MATNEQIIESVKSRQNNGREFSILRRIPNFLGGELIVIEVIKSEQLIGENYVFVGFDKTIKKTFLSMDELAIWINNNRKPQKDKGFLSSDYIPAIIAILITITICGYIFMKLYEKTNQEIKVPEILANALTTILGFYFGSQINKPKVTSPKVEDHTA